MLSELYDLLGDTLALQYAGSVAHKKYQLISRPRMMKHSKELFISIHRHYSNVRFRMDASLEPMGVVGDLGYYAFLGLLALSKHPHAAARTVQCKAHFADSETDVVVDASGSLSLDGGGAGRRRNAVFSLSYIKPKAEELAIISGDGVSGGGRLAQGLVTGGAELRVVRHAFADNSTSDATFSRKNAGATTW